MNQVIQYQNPGEIIYAQQQHFESVAPKDINFAKEAEFAVQILQGNSYSARIAMQNQQSLVAAIRNVAAIGISLNPAAKHAYLVPRGGKICLDVGYLGLMHIATESGSILWVQCEMVYENDTYCNNGVDKAPTHKRNKFNKKSRGAIVGAYCVAKTRDGSFLTEEMDIDEIHAIRARSESFKKGGTSPWVTDYGEMVRKTVIKRAYKYWPKSDRMTAAVDMLNQQEGIDFKSEQSSGRDITPINDETIGSIQQALQVLGRPVDGALNHFSSTLFKRTVSDLADLTAEEAGKMMATLNQMVDAKLAKEQQQGGVF